MPLGQLTHQIFVLGFKAKISAITPRLNRYRTACRRLRIPAFRSYVGIQIFYLQARSSCREALAEFQPDRCDTRSSSEPQIALQARPPLPKFRPNIVIENTRF